MSNEHEVFDAFGRIASTCCLVCRSIKWLTPKYAYLQAIGPQPTPCPNCKLRHHAQLRAERLKVARRERHTRQEWLDLLEKYGGKCAVCGGGCGEHSFHKDHIIPISRGGHDGISNIRPACFSCNCSKGGQLDEELSEREKQWLKSLREKNGVE